MSKDGTGGTGDRCDPDVTIDLQEYERRTHSNFPRNFRATVVDGMMIQVAGALIGPAIITIYYKMLFDRISPDAGKTFNTFLGYISAGAILLNTVPAFFSARWGETVPRKAPVVFILGWVFRFQWLACLISAGVLADQHPVAAIILVVSGSYLAMISQGFNVNLWIDFVGKLFPVGTQGKVHGYRQMFGGASAIAALILAVLILNHPWLKRAFPFPNNFAMIFAIATFATLVSQIALISTRETAYPVKKQRVPMRTFLKNWWRAGHQDIRLRRIVFAFSLGRLTAFGGLPFIAVRAVEIFNASSGKSHGAALFGFHIGSVEQMAFITQFCITIGTAISGLFFGRIYDKMGLWLWRMGVSSIRFGSYFWLVFAERPWEILAIFLIISISNAAAGIGFVSIANTIAPGNRRMRYHLWFIFPAIVSIPVSILAGYIADRFGLQVNFFITSLFVLTEIIFSFFFFPKVIPAQYNSDKDEQLKEIAEAADE